MYIIALDKMMKLILVTFLLVTCVYTHEREVCEIQEDGSKLCHIHNHEKEKYSNKEEIHYAEQQKEDVLIHRTFPFPFKIPDIIPNGLSRMDGVEIGHETIVDVGKGETVRVITRSLKPLLFEIPDFLSNEECDHIIKRAQDPEEGGMFRSQAKGGLTQKPIYNITGEKGKAHGFYDDFEEWDKNENGVIDIPEIISIIHKRRVLSFNDSDVREMFKSVEEEKVLEDDVMSKEEFSELNSMGIEDYLHIQWSSNPRFKERWSQQAWLHMEQWIDPTIHNIREKLVKISGLPRSIIYGGERLQVVHYSPGGHYHAHHDSETHKRDVPCCHQYEGDVINSVGECKLCRYITFVMYLNDVEEGGETAFPVAGDEGYDPETIRAHGNVSEDKYNLSHGCKRANVIVKAKKRQAVLWYNHDVNKTDGWMGELDLHSLHGGCDVIKGEKWIANMWIPAPYSKNTYTLSNYLIPKDFMMAEVPADYTEELKALRKEEMDARKKQKENTN